MIRLYIIYALLLLSLGVFGQKPNIILIMTDDQGYAEYSYDNPARWSTPNIDNLFNNGALFERWYVDEKCTPSRAQLLSGRYAFRNGTCMGTIKTQSNRSLPRDEKLLPQYLKDLGYVTAQFGKWHLGNAYEWQIPHNRGFDESRVFLSGSPNDFFDRKGISGKLIDDYSRNGYLATDFSRTDYLTYRQTDDAVNFINAVAPDNTRPFFIYLPYNDPHAPMDADPTLVSQAPDISNAPPLANASNYQALWAKIKAVDNGVGDIMAALQANGIEENTIVIYLSDNGAVFNNGGDSGDLKGEKGDYFEGGVNTKCVWYWKDKIQARVIDRNHWGTVLDFLPTLLEGAIPAGDELNTDVVYSKPIDGINVWSTVFDGQPTDTTRIHIIEYFPDRWWCAVQGNYKATNRPIDDMSRAFPQTSTNGYSGPVSWGLADKDNPDLPISDPIVNELYDLSSDPTEDINIYSSNIAIHLAIDNYVQSFRDSTDFDQTVFDRFNDFPPSWQISDDPNYWGDWRHINSKNTSYYWNIYRRYTGWDDNEETF